MANKDVTIELAKNIANRSYLKAYQNINAII